MGSLHHPPTRFERGILLKQLLLLSPWTNMRYKALRPNNPFPAHIPGIQTQVPLNRFVLPLKRQPFFQQSLQHHTVVTIRPAHDE